MPREQGGQVDQVCRGQGSYFDEVEIACSKWWMDNGSAAGDLKKEKAKVPSGSEANVSVPDLV